MKNYYIEGQGGWFVVSTENKRKARSAGVLEFGRGNVRSVQVATKDQTQMYILLRGENAMRQ